MVGRTKENVCKWERGCETEGTDGRRGKGCFPNLERREKERWMYRNMVRERIRAIFSPFCAPVGRRGDMKGKLLDKWRRRGGGGRENDRANSRPSLAP